MCRASGPPFATGHCPVRTKLYFVAIASRRGIYNPTATILEKSQNYSGRSKVAMMLCFFAYSSTCSLAALSIFSASLYSSPFTLT